MLTAEPQPICGEPLASLRGITKRFQHVLANDRIDLDLFPGEIHALLGENGAGKSTLMKILYGFYRADAGEILFHGAPVLIRSPQDARRMRMGMVFQNLNLIPAMTVAENIALFLQDLPPVYSPEQINARILEFSKTYGLEVNPDDRVSQLAIGEQQKVEILKLLMSDARLLILDEPTRVLAPHEIDALIATLENLKQNGYSIVLITHKMGEVRRCADRISVLRAGKLVGTIPGNEVNEETLINMMFEKSMPGDLARATDEKRMPSEAILQLERIETCAEGAGTSLKEINLLVNTGEIVGIAGVSGNGQKELGDLVLGMEKPLSGRKLYFGKDVSRAPIGQLRKDGVAFIPENPLSMATVPFMTVLENMALVGVWRYARRGGLKVDWDAVKSDLQTALSRFGFSFSPYSMVRALSGGNLQRLIIAREMAHSPRLIIASYISSGLDVQSAAIARQALLQARDAGAGVLLISEDLEELFSLSDRLAVLFEGRIVGEFRPSETDLYTVGRLMTGMSG